MQVLSAALKVAQLDSPTDGSPKEDEPSSLPEGDGDSPGPESEPAEVQVESEQSPAEEEPMAEPPPVPESCPIQEQGEMETQTEPQEGQENSPPGSPVLVRDDSDHSSVVSPLSVLNSMGRTYYIIYFVHRIMLVIVLFF